MRLESFSDEELIKTIKSKNEYSNSALGRLYTKYYNALCGFSKSILGSKEDAEDNVNDVFYNVFLDSNSFDSYKEKGSFKSWILSIAHNTAVNKLRMKKLKNKFLEENVSEFNFSSEGDFCSKENRGIIREKLKKMGDIYSEIIYLRESFDMDYDEIENFLGVPSSTCRSRNRRAVKALRRNLVEEYGAEQFFS